MSDRIESAYGIERPDWAMLDGTPNSLRDFCQDAMGHMLDTLITRVRNGDTEAKGVMVYSLTRGQPPDSFEVIVRRNHGPSMGGPMDMGIVHTPLRHIFTPKP